MKLFFVAAISVLIVIVAIAHAESVDGRKQNAVESAAELKIQQCEHIVSVYNRCETSMDYDPSKNAITFGRGLKAAKCDDGKILTFEQRLEDADISSMMSQSYHPGKMDLPERHVDFSPGGIRNQEFNQAVYGTTADEVKKNLIVVDFLGHKAKFNRKNGAARALADVNTELMRMYKAKSDKRLVEFLKPFIEGGCKPAERCKVEENTFNWRPVAGSVRLSNHSFGAAIDLQPESGTEYWLWDVEEQIKSGKAIFRPGTNLSKPGGRDVVNFIPKSNPEYPLKLVDAFERHGFVWGGKWYRYDVMHFEFHPEFFPDEIFPCGK